MNNEKMKNSLQKSLIRISVIIVIFISISVGTLCFDIYRRDMISRYQNYAGDAINFLSSCIDVDDLEECIDTVHSIIISDYYKTENMTEFLKTIREDLADE